MITGPPLDATQFGLHAADSVKNEQRRENVLGPFLIWVLDGGAWSALRPPLLYSQDMGLRYPMDRRMDGPQVLYG
jgi:hypothetical protein